MRHHFAVARASRDLPGAHMIGHTETALERRTLFTSKWKYASVGQRILPCVFSAVMMTMVSGAWPDSVDDLSRIWNPSSSSPSDDLPR